MVWEMGLIIEANEDCFKVLCSNHKTKFFPNSVYLSCKIAVGEWIDWDEETGVIENRKPKFPAKLVDGVLQVETLACCPNPMLISKANREKWENALWSPYIGLIRDDKELFLPLTADELYAVTVNYAGSSGKYLWESASVGWRCEDLKVQLAVTQAPWTLEQVETEIEETSKKDHSDTIIGRKRVDEKNTYCGFVYQRDNQGFFWLWGHSTGKVSVWLHEKPELGNWCSFNLKSISYDSLNRANKRFKVFAFNLVNIDERLEPCRLSPTEFGVRITVKLNSKIIREKHCWDYVLGKVDIPNRVLSEIGKLTKTLRSDHFEIIGISKILSTAVANAEMCWSLQEIEQVIDCKGTSS